VTRCTATLDGDGMVRCGACNLWIGAKVLNFPTEAGPLRGLMLSTAWRPDTDEQLLRMTKRGKRELEHGYGTGREQWPRARHHQASPISLPAHVWRGNRGGGLPASARAQLPHSVLWGDNLPMLACPRCDATILLDQAVLRLTVPT